MDSNVTTAQNLSGFSMPHMNTTQHVPPPSNASLGHALLNSLTSTGILAVMCNIVALLLTLTKASLRTPFNMYIVALMCSNVVFVSTDRTLLALADIYGTLWLGNSLCTVRLYSLYMLAPLVYNLHWVITLNRTWALFGPISYRARHNRTTAGILCGAVVFYVHIFMLPQLIRDHLYYRLPLEKGCRLNTDRQFVLNYFTSILIYDVPCVGVTVVYPPLLWKMLSRRRMRRVNNPERRRPDGRQEAIHRPFILLTLYTFSTMVSWMPIMCFYTIASNFPTVKLSPTFYQAASNLYNVESILDPLFFCLTIGGVRNYVRRFCSRTNNNEVGTSSDRAQLPAAATESAKTPNAIPNVAVVI